MWSPARRLGRCHRNFGADLDYPSGAKSAHSEFAQCDPVVRVAALPRHDVLYQEKRPLDGDPLPRSNRVADADVVTGYARHVNTVSSFDARHRGSVRVGSILIRCVRFDELVAFWQAALGYVPREPPQDGWVVLTDPSGVGPNISLDRVVEDRLPPLGDLSRVHLDLYTADQHAEVERLLGLGATRYEREYGHDEDFVVLVDPDGNRFCVIDKPDLP